MRICLIGLPRCGSQHLAEIIKRSYPNMTDCLEPFTDSDFLKDIDLRETQIILSKNKKYKSVRQRVETVCDIIDRSNPNQNLVLRLFLLDNIDSLLPQIVYFLKKNNFKFLVLKRDSTEQLLSWAIARTTDKYNTITKGYNNGQKFKVTDFHNIQWLFNQQKEFDRRLSALDIEYKTIHYATLYQDLEQLLNIQVNQNILTFKKQVVGNHYDYIENAEQVKEIIENITNGTKIY